MSEERRVRRRGGSVDREQRSRDGAVGPAAAIQKLCTVGDLLREGMPEGALTWSLRETEELSRCEAFERCREVGCRQTDHDAQQLGWYVSPDHSRRLEHVL